VSIPETSIRMVRVFKAPVEEVFKAFTDPVLMRQWLAPTLCRVVEASADPRVGGHYRVVVKPPIGGPTITTGEYREIVPNHRLVQTWVVERSKDPAHKYPTLLTVDFKALGADSTEITLQQDQLITKFDRAGNLAGWGQCFKNLDRLLVSSRVA